MKNVDFDRDCPRFVRPFRASFEITTSHETQIVDFLSSFTIDFALRQGAKVARDLRYDEQRGPLAKAFGKNNWDRSYL